MLTGTELRHLRLDAELQQQDVAAAAGIDRWRLSQIERGPIQGKPLSMQEERAIRRAITRLLAVERQRKLLLTPGLRAKRIRRPHPRPDTDGTVPGPASGQAMNDAEGHETTFPDSDSGTVPEREEGATDPVSAR